MGFNMETERVQSITKFTMGCPAPSTAPPIQLQDLALLIARLPPFLLFLTCLEKQYLILLRSCLCRPSSPNTSTVAKPSRPQIRQVVKAGTAEFAII